MILARYIFTGFKKSSTLFTLDNSIIRYLQFHDGNFSRLGEEESDQEMYFHQVHFI